MGRQPLSAPAFAVAPSIGGGVDLALSARTKNLGLHADRLCCSLDVLQLYPAGGYFGFISAAIIDACGTKSCNMPSRFGSMVLVRRLIPVAFPRSVVSSPRGRA